MSAPCGYPGPASGCPMTMDLRHVVHCLTYLVDDHVTAEETVRQERAVERKYTKRWDCQRCEQRPESLR
jgi:hypothetical protein